MWWICPEELHNVLESAYLYLPDSPSFFCILVPQPFKANKTGQSKPQLHPQQCPSESHQLRQGHVILWDFVHPGFFVQNDLQGSQVLPSREQKG